MIGRSSELRAVEAFLDRSADGPGALTISGEAGIGKTTLLRAGLEAARERGYAVLSCAPAELETKLAYSALGDLLEDVPRSVIAALSAPHLQSLDRALLGRGIQGADQRAVGLAVLATLRRLAETAPVVLGIDDLQWLDESSARVLHFALRRRGDAAVSVFATVRCDGTAAPIDPLPRGADDLVLQPLDERAIAELVAARIERALGPAVLRRLHRASGGNPFFAIELARATLQDPESVGRDRIAVPQSLHDLLGERIGDLSADVRRALLIVAAASQPTVALVEAVLGSRDRAFNLLSAAIAGEILQVERGRLRFSHPLLASILYGDAGREEQRRVHAELAETVDDIEERAHHLAYATELPDAAVARALDDAAARATARGAPAAAAGFAEHALRLTHVDDQRAVARRTLAAADARWSAGETSRARVLLDELAATMTPGVERARVLRQLARARAYEDGFVAAMEPLERALEEVGDDVRLRAALERDIALAIMNAGDIRRAEPHAQAALDAAKRLADPELSADAEATNDAMRFLLGRGAPAGLAPRARRLARAGEELDLHPGFLARAQILASILKWSDDFSAARSIFEELRHRLTEREEEGPLVPVLFHLGELECWAGNLSAAAAIADELESIAPRLGPTTASQALYLSGFLAALRGDVDDAKRAATRGLALAEGRDVRLVLRNLKVLGFVGISTGDSDDAHGWLTRASDLAASNGFIDPGFLRVAADVIEALVGAGELDRAERDAVELENLGRRLDRPWALATGARSLALVASAREDSPAAVSALEQALIAHERLPEPLERARTLLALGSVHRRARRKRLARETLAEAQALFESLPAPLWVERSRREAARIGGRVSVGTELTEVERRIAELVAEGRSNAEVASVLVVSRKTVEWNLSNVYRKLGVRSRTELARKAAAER